MTESVDFLIVDDDEVFAGILGRALSRKGFTVEIANSAASAIRHCSAGRPVNVVLDMKLGDTSGLQLIPQILSHAPDSAIVLLTGYSSIPTTVEAIKLGARNYLCKPVSVEELLDAFALPEANPDVDLPATPPSVDRLQWEHIQKVLADNNGNVSATARALGMHRRTLQRKLQKKPVSN